MQICRLCEIRIVGLEVELLLLLLTSVGSLLSPSRIDLAVLLGKTPSSMENESTNLESSQAPSLAQPLVFSNSKQSAISQPASGNSFSHHSMVRGQHFDAQCLESCLDVLCVWARWEIPAWHLRSPLG